MKSHQKLEEVPGQTWLLLDYGCEGLEAGVRAPLTSAVGPRSAGLPPGAYKGVSPGGSLDGQEYSWFMAEGGSSQITGLVQDLQLDPGWRSCLRAQIDMSPRAVEWGLPGESELASWEGLELDHTPLQGAQPGLRLAGQTPGA